MLNKSGLFMAVESINENIIDTDSRNGRVFNWEQEKTSGAIDVKNIDKANGIKHVPSVIN